MADRPLTPADQHPDHGRVHIVFDDNGEIVEYQLHPSPDQTRRLGKALLLAPTLEIARALIAGEKVPIHKLDPAMVRRYWKKPA